MKEVSITAKLTPASLRDLKLEQAREIFFPQAPPNLIREPSWGDFIRPHVERHPVHPKGIAGQLEWMRYAIISYHGGGMIKSKGYSVSSTSGWLRYGELCVVICFWNRHHHSTQRWTRSSARWFYRWSGLKWERVAHTHPDVISAVDETIVMRALA